jgi:amidohydrolase
MKEAGMRSISVQRSAIKSLFLLFFLLAAYTPGIADDKLKQAINSDYPHLQRLYTHLHRHPELSFHEQKTSELIAKELRALGFEVTQGVGGYGVVALLRNGKGPTVMIRTDMDALPVKEQTLLPYASTVTFDDNATGRRIPVMHACGHDAHMSIFVGTARRLAAMKAEWSGTLMLIGEPAEEKGEGARRMLADGLFKRFARPDYNLALHVDPGLPAGTVGIVSGYAFANVDSVDIDVYGIGAHGAVPQAGKDPIVLAAQIILALQTIVSRELAPHDAAVITVGSIHGGTQHNIIPEKVTMQLTVRTYGDATRQKVLDAIKRIAVNQARAFGMPEDKLPKISVKKEYTPSVYNDPKLTERVRQRFDQLFGPGRVKTLRPAMIGEDFSRYGRTDPRIPSLMFRLGATDPKIYAEAQAGKTALPPLHSPRFAPFPKATITTGVEAMTSAALLLMKKGG